MLLASAIFPDVLKVIADMSEQTAADIKMIGATPDEVLGFFAGRVPGVDAVSFISGERPVIVMGWDKMPDGWYSWFIATPKGFTVGATIAVRRHLRAVQGAHPGVELLCIALLNDERVGHWFRALGCRQVERGGVKLWLFAG